MSQLYELLKKAGFKHSTYLPLAAYTISKELPMNQLDSMIERMDNLYNKMKKLAPLRSSRNEVIVIFIATAFSLTLKLMQLQM